MVHARDRGQADARIVSARPYKYHCDGGLSEMIESFDLIGEALQC
jgi:hypothetical protein